MFGKILSFFSWLLSLWSNLSDEDKEKIVDTDSGLIITPYLQSILIA